MLTRHPDLAARMASDLARLPRGCKQCESQAVRRKYEAMARARSETLKSNNPRNRP